MEQFCRDVDKWFLTNTRKSLHDNDIYNAFVVLKIICHFHRNNGIFGVNDAATRTKSRSPNYKS